MPKYIAKADTWFRDGCECKLLVDLRPQLNAGIFRGERISNGAPELHSEGEIYMDEESCNFDEFEVVDG